MATATAVVTRTVTLQLTHEEADWLRTLVQNQIPSTGVEPRHEREIRQAIFMALNDTPLSK